MSTITSLNPYMRKGHRLLLRREFGDVIARHERLHKMDVELYTQGKTLFGGVLQMTPEEITACTSVTREDVQYLQEVLGAMEDKFQLGTKIADWESISAPSRGR